MKSHRVRPRGRTFPPPKPQSYLEESFALWLAQTDLPAACREYHFAHPKRWRFDFAWPDHLVAVEIEGITHQRGRHQTYAGFLRDCAKYEAALMRGWTVYRVAGPWVASPRRHVWRAAVMDNLRELLSSSTPPSS